MTLLAPAAVARLTGASGPAHQLATATGVAFNSAHVQPGDLFVAMPGATTHGIEYAQQALDQGAAYVLSDRPHPQGLTVEDPAAALLALGREARSRLRGPVIGITGTAGKTTTKALVAAALQARSTPGNFNTPFALAQTLVAAHLAELAHADHQALVLELGIDHTGEMDQLIELTRPEHAIVTTIGASHLAGLGTVDGVAREKGKLLLAAPGVKLVGKAAAAHLPAAALRHTAVVSAPVTLHGAEGSTVHVLGVGVRLPWPGRPAAEGAALALTLAAKLGLSVQLAAQNMLRAQLEGGRLQRSSVGSITLLDDSYNSNPVSLRAALELLLSAPAPRVAFLGDMLELGDREAPEHLAMGEATVGLDLVVGVGQASALMRQTNPHAEWAPDPEAACRFLEQIPEGATVLVKGSRGVRMEKITQKLKGIASPEGAPA